MVTVLDVQGLNNPRDLEVASLQDRAARLTA